MAPASLYTAFVALAILPCSLAEPKVFGMKFNKVKRDAPSSGIQRRANTVSEPLYNGQNLYIANISLGSNQQTLSVQLDTGSSDLWVPDTNSNICQQPDCTAWGSFDPSKSTTATQLDAEDFVIDYGDGSHYEGYYFTDNLAIGEAKVKDVIFAVVKSATGVIGDGSNLGNNGVMGIGFDSNEAAAARGDGQPYRGLVSQLKQQGLIKTLSYSLWLDDEEAKTGSILFGGVDTSKYVAPLIAMPMVGFEPRAPRTVNEVAIEMTSIELTDDSGTSSLTDSNTVIPALLDSGTTATQFPSDIAQKIMDTLGAVNDPNFAPVPFVPCSLSTAKATYVFGFGGSSGPKINVPVSQLIGDPDGVTTFADGSPACVLSVSANEQGQVVLGDSFLRSAYVVYHLQAKTIALADANTNPGSSSDIQEIDSNDIPGINGKVLSSAPATFAVPTVTAAATTEINDPFADIYATSTIAAAAASLTENPGKASFTAQSSIGSSGATGKSVSVSAAGVPKGKEALAVVGVVGLLSVLGGSTFLMI